MLQVVYQQIKVTITGKTTIYIPRHPQWFSLTFSVLQSVHSLLAFASQTERKVFKTKNK